MRQLAREKQIAFGRLVHPTRVALTGKRAGPGIFDVIYCLGRERVVERLRAAHELVQAVGSSP